MRILVTAGPTREYLDSVRFLTNASSGITGFMTAAAARTRGHRVVLVSGPTACEKPAGVRVIPVVTARDMHRRVLKIFPHVDAVIMTAAVGDYRPIRTGKCKRKKTGANLLLELVPTPDILAELGRRKKHQLLVGFALEDRAGRAHARRKFRKKNLDAVILNSPRALGSADNRVQVYTSCAGWRRWPAMSKARLGKKIVALVEQLAERKSPP